MRELSRTAVAICGLLAAGAASIVWAGEVLPAAYVIGIGDDPNGTPEEIDSRDHFHKVAAKFGASRLQIIWIFEATGGVVCPVSNNPSSKYVLGTGFLIGSNEEIATAKHVFDSVIRTEGVQGLSRCFYRTLAGDIPLDFEAKPHLPDGGYPVVRSDTISRVRLQIPVKDAEPLPLDPTPIRENERILSFAAYQAEMIRKVPVGEPIGAIGYVRAVKSVGYYSDLDMTDGGSGGPSLTWEGEGADRYLAVAGVTLQSGQSELNGRPYDDTPTALADRNLTFSLYISSNQ